MSHLEPDKSLHYLGTWLSHMGLPPEHHLPRNPHLTGITLGRELHGMKSETNIQTTAGTI